MEKSYLLGTMCACSLAIFSHTANASTFDVNVTPGVIFGSGVTNGNFTVDQGSGIELGLRGKLRHNASGLAENTYNSNGDGTYSFDAGVAPTQSSPTAVWSFEWSINSNFDGSGNNLSAYTYQLGVDSNPGLGQTWSIFDPINVAEPGWFDHSMGNNGTTAGTDVIATDRTSYLNLISSNNVAQNSWKAHWFLDNTFDPTVDGQYDFYLAAFDGATQLARTDISIIVGVGAVPVPAAVWLFGSGLLGLVGMAYRKERRQS